MRQHDSDGLDESPEHDALGGRRSPGRWAGLAASLTELGVDLETAKGFRPIVIDYVRTHGGEDLVDKMQRALKI